MSNMNLQGLDKLDRRIISNLLSNGRESIANLSRNVGLSRTAVAERINDLRKRGSLKDIQRKSAWEIKMKMHHLICLSHAIKDKKTASLMD